MSRISVVNPVAHIARVTRCSSQAERFRVPMICVDGTAAYHAALRLEAKMRRRVIVPDIATGFIPKVLGLNEQRPVTSRDTIAAEDIIIGDTV
ncbi:MAG: hypothetical protein P8016_13645, partial [Sedimentisphaerales bacterium]